MTLKEFNLPGCWVIDAFLSYMEYDKYNYLKEKLNISNFNRRKYVEDAISIYGIEGISIDKCKIIVADECETDGYSNATFVLVAIPSEKYNASIKPLDDEIFAYIGKQLGSKNTAFGLMSPINRKIFVKFVPDELCDIKSEYFDLMKYLTIVYECIHFAVNSSKCGYNMYMPVYSAEIFTLIYFLQIFNTSNNKEVVKRLFRKMNTFLYLEDKDISNLVDDIFDFIGEDINNHLNDYNSFYKFINRLDIILRTYKLVKNVTKDLGD